MELKLRDRGAGPRDIGGFLQLDVAHRFGPDVATGERNHPFAATLQVALNIGVGIDVVYFGERMRGACNVGPSVLLRDNIVDSAGAVGVFVDLRPMGVRVDLPRGAVLVIDPLTFTKLVPDLSGIPLFQLEYRTQQAAGQRGHLALSRWRDAVRRPCTSGHRSPVELEGASPHRVVHVDQKGTRPPNRVDSIVREIDST